MNRQTAGLQSVLEAVRDFLKFVLDDDRTMALDSYLEEVRFRGLNLTCVVFDKKSIVTGLAAFFAAVMSYGCEMARVFVVDTAPTHLPMLAESAGWEAYLKAPSLAMGLFGLMVALIGYVLYWASLEKFKARRGMRSIYPQYPCFYANLAFSIAASSVPIAGIACVQSSRLTSSLTTLFLVAWTLSFVRILTLAPRSMYKNVASLLVAFDAMVAFALIGRKVELSQELIISLSAMYFLLHVVWACVLGINELRIFVSFRISGLRSHEIANTRKAMDCRTPRQWAGRSLSFFAVQLICLFPMLCIIMMVPPYFISLNMLLFS